MFVWLDFRARGSEFCTLYGHQGAENLTSGFPPEHVLCARENLAHLASPKMLTQENQAVFQPWRVYR